MTEYRLLSIWRIDAPLEDVYAAIRDSLDWPAWWPAVRQVETIADGRADGIDSVRRYVWQGLLPYCVNFNVRTSRIEALQAIEGVASGDLEGNGRWHFSREGGLSIVRYEWHVRTTRGWMNLLSPLARPIFIANHNAVMRQGGEGLARWLGVSLVSQENLDLLTGESGQTPLSGHRREHGRIDPLMVLVSGVAAGVLATVAQIGMWWLAEMPLAETLFRDARLAAALLMGGAVLPPPSTAQWDILLVATLIHFALSIFYAVLPAYLAGRLSTGWALAAGGFYGLLIYALNMYGLTAVFPWFTVARDWPTVIAHLVFGMTLAGGCRLYLARRTPG